MNGRDGKLIDLNASTSNGTTDLLKRALDVIELCSVFNSSDISRAGLTDLSTGVSELQEN